MKACLSVVLASLLTLGAMPAPTSAADAADVLRRVQARYDATEDFVADVTQEMKVASLDKTITSHGTVAFKKPGRMRWEFVEEERQTIVADGETLWFYRPDEQQVFKTPFRRAFRSTTPISFLTGVGELAEDFIASLDGESRDNKLYYLMLFPKVENSDVGRLRLFVTQDTADILGAEIQDPLGNVSTLRFSKMRRNVGLEDRRFTFQVPEGVDVITAPTSP